MNTPRTELDFAILFHETYERLAPSFGYETRPDTRAFDPESKNGLLMLAVMREVAMPLASDLAAAQEARQRAEGQLSAMTQSRDEWKHRYEQMDDARIAAEADNELLREAVQFREAEMSRRVKECLATASDEITKRETAEERAEEYRNELDRFKEEREGNTRQFRRLQERLAQAEADAFSMSAGQCIVTNGGLMGDDHGHLYCDMQRQRDEQRGRLRVMADIMNTALDVMKTVEGDGSDEDEALMHIRAKMASAIDSVRKADKAAIAEGK